MGTPEDRRQQEQLPEFLIMSAPKPVVLCILDGWGLSDDTTANLAAYADPDLPIAQDVVEAVTQFLEQIDE